MGKILIKVLVLILDVVTPEIRDGLRDLLVTLRRRAAETPNPFDDMLVECLFGLLDIDTDEID